MSRAFFITIASIVAGAVLVAAPVPQEPVTKALVDMLSNPDQKVRDEAVGALKDRTDALPWLRRAARSTDQDTARRANQLLAPHATKQQKAAAKAIENCLRDNCMDLLTEWHQYWQPEKKDDLWSVGPRAAKPGMDLFAKSCRPLAWKKFKEDLASLDDIDPESCRSHDGPCPAKFEVVDGTWTIRTDRLLHPPSFIRFASVADRGSLGSRIGGQFLVLGRVGASTLDRVFMACDGDVSHLTTNKEGATREVGVTTELSIIICRGSYTGANTVRDSVLLVDGDIDLTRSEPRHCLIRATGEIRLPKGFAPENCMIEPYAKNATAPYKFFELSDMGLSLADDEEGLVVRAVKAETPFGNGGLQKGDLVLAINDVPTESSEEFRRKVRKALVRQGDCLITVVRGGKTHDLPVFFPLPK